MQPLSAVQAVCQPGCTAGIRAIDHRAVCAGDLVVVVVVVVIMRVIRACVKPSVIDAIIIIDPWGSN